MIKKLRVTVDGKPYDVTVEIPEEPAAAPSIAAPAPLRAPEIRPSAPAPQPAAAKPTGPGAVTSPLAGRVTAIAVNLGQDVKEGDHLLTLEAMKMNTFVVAPKAGKVAEVNVAVGDAVNEGQPLVCIA